MWKKSKTLAKDQQLDKKNYDALSTPGYVIKKKKTSPMVPKHGASERQRMNNKAKEMLQKARQPKHGGYKTMLERWRKDDKYRKSLSAVGWTEEQIIQYDELALEDHSFFAAREEKNSKREKLGTLVEEKVFKDH